jgi:hypothetical protein
VTSTRATPEPTTGCCWPSPSPGCRSLRFVDGLTQSEIADQIGISQMHVSRLLAGSLAKLREAFASEG